MLNIHYYHCHILNEQSELADIKYPSFPLSKHISSTASSCPFNSDSFSFDSKLNLLKYIINKSLSYVLIDASSLAMRT